VGSQFEFTYTGQTSPPWLTGFKECKIQVLPIHPPLGNFNWYQSQTSHQNLITVRNDDVLTSKHVKENAKLKARLEVLTSKYVKMQKDHEMLKYSHENLQDAHVML
jgi:hypothetical protein